MNTNDLHRIFMKLDRNGDGLVSLDELRWFPEKIGIHTSLHELESLAGKTSLDPIDFILFYDTLVAKSNINEKSKSEKNLDTDDLLKAFKVYDLNGDGFISCKELQSVLLRLGLWDEHSGRDCESMISVYDANFDGLLDFEEFKKMMLHTD